MLTVEQLAEIIYDACYDTSLNLIQSTVKVISNSKAVLNQALFNDVSEEIRRYRDSHKDLEKHTKVIHALLFGQVGFTDLQGHPILQLRSDVAASQPPVVPQSANTYPGSKLLSTFGGDTDKIQNYLEGELEDYELVESAMKVCAYLADQGIDPDLALFAPGYNNYGSDGISYQGKIYTIVCEQVLRSTAIESVAEHLVENIYYEARDRVSDMDLGDIINWSGHRECGGEYLESGDVLIVTDE